MQACLRDGKHADSKGIPVSTIAYQHSQMFGTLKGITEQIDVNLTSFQYLSVLDRLVYNAIAPLIEHTQFFDVYLGQVLSWQTRNPKRKATGVGRQQFSANVVLYYLQDDPAKKLKIVQKTKLDRGILFEALRRWLDLCIEYDQIKDLPATPDRIIHLTELHSKLAMRPNGSLHFAFSSCRYWNEQAQQFKSKILEKYVRKCLMTAQRDYKALQHRVPLNDIIQTYLMVASKAIDKCDTDKGVLTTHIENWLLSAKNVVVSTYLQDAAVAVASAATSSTTSTTASRSNTSVSGSVSGLTLMETVSLDEAEDVAAEPETDYLEEEQEFEHMRRIAKIFDSAGVGRILLGVQESLSVSDKQALHAVAVIPRQ
jgi:hypothetical protein